MIFYFLRADKYAECKVIIPGKEVNLGAGEGMQVPCLLKISGTKDKFKTNRNIAIYFFFQSLNQQSDEFDSITPNALANSKAFSFIMAPSIGISWLLLSIYQLYISTFSQFPQRVFFLEESIPLNCQFVFTFNPCRNKVSWDTVFCCDIFV